MLKVCKLKRTPFFTPQFFLLALLFVAPTTVHAAVIVDFFDDFNDGNTDGWEFETLDMRDGLGDWRVEGGVLTQSKRADHYQALVENLVMANQTVEAQVNTKGYAGITIWYQNEFNFTSVIIYPAWTGIVVNEFVGGEWFPLPYEFRTSGDTWYDLRIDADSSSGELDIFLDNNYIFTYLANTPYRTGQSGLTSGNDYGYFDNFKLASSVIPEPSTMLLIFSGLLGLPFVRGKR